MNCSLLSQKESNGLNESHLSTLETCFLNLMTKPYAFNQHFALWMPVNPIDFLYIYNSYLVQTLYGKMSCRFGLDFNDLCKPLWSFHGRDCSHDAHSLN